MLNIQKDNSVYFHFVFICFTHFDIVNITVNSTDSGHRQFRVTFKKHLFFTYDIVFRNFDNSGIYPHLLAASN